MSNSNSAPNTSDGNSVLSEIQSRVGGVFRKKPKTIEAFIDAMLASKMIPFPFFADGVMRGFSISVMGISGKVSAKDVGDRLRWGSLKKRLSYNPEIDDKILLELVEKIKKGLLNGEPEQLQIFEQKRGLGLHSFSSDEPPLIIGTSAQDRAIPFKFSNTPSLNLLMEAFSRYDESVGSVGVEDSVKGCGWLYLDQGATGTGKSHALAKGTSEYVRNAVGKKTVICVVPEKRHGAAIKLDLGREMDVSEIRVIPKNSEAMVEYGIPSSCPLKADDSFAKDKIRRLEDLAKDVRKEQDRGVDSQKNAISSLLDRIDTELKELRQNCKRFIKVVASDSRISSKDKCSTCRGCTTMFPGAALFEKDKPSVSVLTYDKLFFGLPSFEVKRGRVKFFSYSPFVREAGAGGAPFKNCIFLMEEYSQGHTKVVSRIEENALNLSLVSTAKMVRDMFDRAVDEVCGRIFKEDRAVFEKFKDEIQKVREKVIAGFGEYYLYDESYRPFSSEGVSFNLFPDAETGLGRAMASMNPVYSSLFPREQIGIKQDDFSPERLMHFTVKKFEHEWQMRSNKFNSMPTTARMMHDKIVEPVTWMAAEFVRVTRYLKDSNIDFSLIFLETVTGKNQKMIDFLSSIMQNKDSTKRLPLDKVSGASLLNDFYVCGYEYIEIRQFDGDNIVDIHVRIARPSPEAMVDCLLESENRNVVYISSASCTIKSAVTNFDIDWMKSRHQEKIKILDVDEAKAVLLEKVEKKAVPKIIWGGDTVEGSLLNLNFDFEKKKKSLPYMRAVLEKFASSLYGGGLPSSRSRVAIVFANSGSDAEAIRASFSEFARERLEGRVFNEVKIKIVKADEFASGETEKIRAEAANQLLSHSGSRLTMIITTYGSMTTGANFTLKFDHIPCEEAVFWNYVWQNEVRQYEGSSGVEVDISDIVLVQRNTNLINPDNYIREAHHFAAMGSLDWGFLARNALTYKPDSPSMAMSSAVAKTPHMSAGIFDLMMQSSARMDRTLNSSAEPNVFLSSEFASVLRDADDGVIGSTILPAAITEAMRTAHEQIEASDTCDRVDMVNSVGMSSSEIYTDLARKIRNNESVRHVWELTRDAFVSSGNLVENLVIPCFKERDFLCDSVPAYKGLSKIKRLNAALSDIGISLRNLMFEVPIKFVEVYGDTVQIAYTLDGDTVRFYEPSKAASGIIKNLPVSFGARDIEQIKSFFIMKPAMCKEVIYPAVYEQEIRRIASRQCGRSVMPSEDVGRHLIERADLFIPQVDVCIDAKAWSIDTMSSVANAKSMEELVKDARAKLSLMRNEAQNGQWAPSRYIYGFKRWFNRFVRSGINSGAIYVRSGTESELTTVDGNWDVAFLNIAGDDILRRSLNAIDRSMGD